MRKRRRITADEYDKFYKEFREKIEDIDVKLANLQEAEDKYYLTANYLLQLANRAYELFVSSEIEQRRQLLKLILQNSTLKGRNLHSVVQKPFDTILNYADSQSWGPTHQTMRESSLLFTICYYTII